MAIGLFFNLILNFVVTSSLAQQTQAQYPIRCENLADCPGWVVGISHNPGSQMALCSGTLIAPDIVATSLHCLPLDLRTKGQSCRGKIHFAFPQTKDLPTESVDCDQVLLAGPPLLKDGMQLDFAFVKLAQSLQRPVAVFSQLGFADMSIVTLYKVDPTKGANTFEGVVKKIQCNAIQNSLMNPFFQSDTSPLVMLSSCPIVPGNSGSGIIASDGTIRGVAGTFIKQTFSDPELKKIVETETGATQAASGTNFSCVPSPLEFSPKTPPGDQCQMSTDEKKHNELSVSLVSKEVKKGLAELELRNEKQLKSIESSGPQLLSWSYQSSKKEPRSADVSVLLNLQFRPVCLLPKVQNVNLYESQLKSQTITSEMKISEFGLKQKYDPYLRPQALVDEKVYDLKISLNPKDLLKKTDIEVQISFTDAKSHFVEKFKLDLCQIRKNTGLNSAIGERNQ